MHRPTIEVYEQEGARYAHRRGVEDPERARRFASTVRQDHPGAPILDLGCGPGHHLALLGAPALALDAARSMVIAAAASSGVPVIQGDLAMLPLTWRSLGGVWASKAHQHLPAADLPLALAEIHRVLVTGGHLALTVFSGDGTEEVSTPATGDDLPGRLFTWWRPERLGAVVTAAGFDVRSLRVTGDQGRGHARVEIDAVARLALPDHVGPGLRLLCCGLNPSVHAAQGGVPYITGSNRFWRAMAAAGLATRDRDPRHLARHDRIGCTDLVARPTARADELRPAEYRAGLERLAALCTWLEPAAVAMVGLAGWRAAVDRRARPGWQEERLGPSPVYVLPSTSGLNAGTSLDELVRHLRAAVRDPAVR